MLTIIDTTLRDGEQAPGLAFSAAEKMRVGKLLSALGVDIIEAGIPAMGRVEQEALYRLVQAGLPAAIASWNRMHPADVDASLACGVKFVHLSAPVSDLHLEHKLRKSRSWVLGRMQEVVAYARSKDCRISVGAEDASRADPDFLVTYAQAAQDAGAERMRFSDTVGVLDPFRTYGLIRRLVTGLAIQVEMHAHNDFGLATANTLAAARAGAGAVSVTVNGIGERAGNANLREVARAIRQFCGIDLGYDAGVLALLEELVFTLSDSNRNVSGIMEAI
ncbi:MAG: homocitrate synthase [Candidatus Desulforudis sp.]|nr:homocitrate synthase [Desulforudis sp.]